MPKSTGMMLMPTIGTWAAVTNVMALRRLSKIRRPSLTASSMEPKSSFNSTSAAASRATSVPRDPIAGHRDDFSVTFERLNDAQLLLRGNSAEDVAALDVFRKFIVAHIVELRAGDIALGIGQPDRVRDAHGGRWVVARNDDRADARRVGFLNRLRNAGANRVFERHQTDELEIEVMLRGWEGCAGVKRARHAEHSKSLRRKNLDGAGDGRCRICR